MQVLFLQDLLPFCKNLVDHHLIGRQSGELIDYSLDRILCLQAVHTSPHDIYCLALAHRKKEVFSPCSGFNDIDSREHSSLLELPVEDQFHVARTLELLIDNVVHFAARIDQSSRKNGKASALPHIARCACRSVLQ